MNLLQRAVGAALAVALFVVVFFLTSLLLALGLVAALALWAWLWWRSREAAGRVIEGEFRREPAQALPPSSATTGRQPPPRAEPGRSDP